MKSAKLVLVAGAALALGWTAATLGQSLIIRAPVHGGATSPVSADPCSPGQVSERCTVDADMFVTDQACDADNPTGCYNETICANPGDTGCFLPTGMSAASAPALTVTDGATGWSDGTSAFTCKDYIEGNTPDGLPGVTAEAGNDGKYWISDAQGGRHALTCDMGGGGWTRLDETIPHDSGEHCYPGAGTIEDGVWTVRAHYGRLGRLLGAPYSTDHGGCGIWTRVPLRFSEVRFTDKAWPANQASATCAGMLSPNPSVHILALPNGPNETFTGIYGGSSFEYSGSGDTWFSADTHTGTPPSLDLISVYPDAGLTFPSFDLSGSGDYHLLFGVYSYAPSSCHGQTASMRVWIR